MHNCFSYFIGFLVFQTDATVEIVYLSILIRIYIDYFLCNIMQEKYFPYAPIRVFRLYCVILFLFYLVTEEVPLYIEIFIIFLCWLFIYP